MSSLYDSDNDEKPNKSMSISLTTGYEEDDETTRRVGSVSFEPISFATHTVMPSSPFMVNTTLPKAAAAAAAAPLAVSAPPALPSSGLWMLKSVPTLPEFHPLERTAVFVPHSHPGEVAARISDVLRERSMEATYDDDKAKVKGVTADGVDFRVRLYRGRHCYSHGIIVEVQRRFGTSYSFHKDTMAILDAAEGKTPPPPPPSLGGSSSSNSSNSIPMVSDNEDDFVVNGSSSLAMVAKMLNHKGYDSHYLAFQTLLPLTDANKMGNKTAKAVSQELLKDGNEVGAIILGLVCAQKEEDDMFKLRALAMTVLANAVKATKGDIDMALREELRPVLLNELNNAEKNPRTAQMAASCLEFLIHGDHDVAELQIALETAEQVGRSRHAGLKFQAGRCLKKIKGGSMR